MDHVQKMYLVPQHQIDKLHNPAPLESTRQSSENDLDKSMAHILNNPESDIHTQALKYTAVLQKYLALIRRRGNPNPNPGRGDYEDPAAPVATPRPAVDTSVVSTIIEHMPVKYKRNAQYVIDVLSKHPDDITWNGRGEVIIDGVIQKGSHLYDLIKNVTQPYKISHDRIPLGWSPFLKKLSEINMPLNVVQNVDAKKCITLFKTTVDASPHSYYTPEPANDTPRARPKGRRRRAKGTPAKGPRGTPGGPAWLSL